MPSARYWRINIPSTPGGTNASVSELAFLDASGTDLSVGGTAFASSFTGTGREASKAFDKNNATSWASVTNGLPAQLGYDHGAAVDVAAVLLRGASANEYPASPSSLLLQYSDDNVTWSAGLRLSISSGIFDAAQNVTLVPYSGIDSVTVAGGAFFLSSATLSGFTTTRLADTEHPFRDLEFGGFGRIVGTVKEDGSPDVPVKRRVRLHREQDGLLVREVWSHPTTGAYSFDYIDATKRYTVITYDYERDYRAVIADNITPEAMP